MRISKLSFGIAALALVAAPAIAQSSLAPSVAPLSGDEEGQAEGSGLILGLLAVAGITTALVVAADGGDDQPLPVSG